MVPGPWDLIVGERVTTVHIATGQTNIEPFDTLLRTAMGK
jgi:hypothetical protein